jgi:hypothetical protein
MATDFLQSLRARSDSFFPGPGALRGFMPAKFLAFEMDWNLARRVA